MCVADAVALTNVQASAPFTVCTAPRVTLSSPNNLQVALAGGVLGLTDTPLFQVAVFLTDDHLPGEDTRLVSWLAHSERVKLQGPLSAGPIPSFDSKSQSSLCLLTFSQFSIVRHLL